MTEENLLSPGTAAITSPPFLFASGSSMSVTAVPLRPIKKGSLTKLWAALGILILAAAALAWAGTSGYQVERTASGVEVRTTKRGSGAQITDQDVVALHYKLHVNGVETPVVQDSRQMGQPFVTTTQGVYPGFGEGIKMMKPGGSYVLTLPPGTHEPQQIPGAPFTPQDSLVFEIDVLQVEPGAAQQFMQMQQMQQLQQMQRGGR